MKSTRPYDDVNFSAAAGINISLYLVQFLLAIFCGSNISLIFCSFHAIVLAVVFIVRFYSPTRLVLHVCANILSSSILLRLMLFAGCSEPGGSCISFNMMKLLVSFTEALLAVYLLHYFLDFKEKKVVQLPILVEHENTN